MALSRDTFRELEDIVGTENISEDHAILDAYSTYQWAGPPSVETVRKRGHHKRPEVVLLPGSTKDIQAIIKLCNRRGLQSRASSTSYGASNALAKEGIVLMDLRRMNKILEIDEKNMYILVEPYVSFIQVQAEVMKRGLNTHIIGAGSQTSYLASHTSVVGNNSQAISMGYSGRNLLGVEWVQSTGEIVRLGAPGSGAGWFSGDGPGPSLRGIMRGASGASGALGVFTKCAAHLHPWPGPKKLNVNGISPYYEAEIPQFFEYHVIEWSTWEQCADAQYKIGASGIAMAFHKTGGPGSHGACVTGNNNEYIEGRKAGRYYVPEVSWALVMAANDEAEHTYQVKTLDKILEETGGKITPTGEEADWKYRDFLTMIKACYIPRLAFRLTGTFNCDGMMGQETIDNCAMALKRDGRLRDKYIETGCIISDDIYHNWGVTYEGGHWALLEGGYPFDPLDEETNQKQEEMGREGSQIALEMPVGGHAWIAGGKAANIIGPHCGNFQRWRPKIKKAFDPNVASDPTNYASPEGVEDIIL